MQKYRWAKFVFLVGAVAALLYGGALERTVIGALGGKYSLFTEFRSDTAANLMHKFDMFRDFTLIAAFVCAVLIWLMIMRGDKTVHLFISIATLYAIACLVFFIYFLEAPAAITSFAVKRALCSSFIIAAPILLYHKPTP